MYARTPFAPDTIMYSPHAHRAIPEHIRDGVRLWPVLARMMARAASTSFGLTIGSHSPIL
jgi:hypothetical protein